MTNINPKRKIFRTKSFKQNSWAVDYDYLDDLSPQDLEYLGQFNDNYYSKGDDARRRDVMNACEEAVPTEDESPTPLNPEEILLLKEELEEREKKKVHKRPAGPPKNN